LPVAMVGPIEEKPIRDQIHKLDFFSTTIAELEAAVVFGPRRVAGYLASHPLCPFVLDDVRNDAPKS